VYAQLTQHALMIVRNALNAATCVRVFVRVLVLSRDALHLL